MQFLFEGGDNQPLVPVSERWMKTVIISQLSVLRGKAKKGTVVNPLINLQYILVCFPRRQFSVTIIDIGATNHIW